MKIPAQLLILVVAGLSSVGLSQQLPQAPQATSASTTPNVTADHSRTSQPGNSDELTELPAEVAARFAEREPRYLVAPSDVMDITFAFAPEFNQSVTVQPDGFITLKEVGDLHVAGKAVPELRKMITEAYSKILNNAVISISLKDFEKPYFVAGGQLQRPGKYELRGTTGLREAVAIAGGMLDSAKRSQVLLFRRVSAERIEVKKIDMKRLLADGQMEDIYLRSGDMIFVPTSNLSKVRSWLPNPSMAIR